MGNSSNFSALDYFIFFGTIGLSLGIGVFFACRRSKSHATIVDYFLAGRKMYVIPAAMSQVVTYQSSLMVIGNPAEVYSYGLKYVYFVVGGTIAYLFAAFTIVPVFHPLKLTSVYKYFNLRYGDNLVRYIVLVFGMIYYIVYMATVTYGTCVALEMIIGIPQWGTIIIFTIVTAIYTSIGGMKAVIWTDVLQVIIMMTGVLAIQIKSIIEVGGFSKVVEIASSRLDMSDFRMDPRIRYQFWNSVVGSMFIFLVNCFQQPGVQRINSTPDVKTARRLYAIAGPLYAVLAFVICSEGVAIYAYYATKRCDPLESGRIANRNGIVPIAVADLFSNMPGLPGIFIASLSSAALSTLSSCLSSLGAVTYEDIIKVNFPNIPENKATLISKLTVFMYGIVAMGFTFLVSILPGSIISVALSLLGCLDGPICGIFLVSMMFRRATSKGVTAGALVGVATIIWMNIGRMLTETISTSTLPPAPIDGCPISNNSFSRYSNNVTTLTPYSYNVTTLPYSYNVTNLNNSFDTSTVLSSYNNADTSSPLVNLYSVSFYLYSFIGCFITMTLSICFSLITKTHTVVDDKYIFSFRRHVYQQFVCTEKKPKENKNTGIVELEPFN